MAVDSPNQSEHLTARLPADLVTMAKHIAAGSGETVGEVIDSAARGGVTRRYKTTLEKLNRDLGGDAGSA